MSDIQLSLASRRSLVSLQSTTKLLNRTNGRLNTGLRVQNVADDPVAYFRAKGLTDRSNVFSERKDEIDQAVSTMDATLNGLDAMDSMVKQMKGLITNMKTATTKDEFTGYIGNVEELMDQYDKLAGDASYNGVNLLAGTSNRLEVSLSNDVTHRITVMGEHLLSTRAATVASTATPASMINPFEVKTLIDALRYATNLHDQFTQIEGYTRLLGFGFSLVKDKPTNAYGYGKKIDDYIEGIQGLQAGKRGHILMAKSILHLIRNADFYKNLGKDTAVEKVESQIFGMLSGIKELLGLSANDMLTFLEALATGIDSARDGRATLAGDAQVLLAEINIRRQNRITANVPKPGATAGSVNAPIFDKQTALQELLTGLGVKASAFLAGAQTLADLMDALKNESIFHFKPIPRLGEKGKAELKALEEILKNTKEMGLGLAGVYGGVSKQELSLVLKGGEVEKFLKRYKHLYQDLQSANATGLALARANRAAVVDFLHLFLPTGNVTPKLKLDKDAAGLMHRLFDPSANVNFGNVFIQDRAADHASFWKNFITIVAGQKLGGLATLIAPGGNLLTMFKGVRLFNSIATVNKLATPQPTVRLSPVNFATAMLTAFKNSNVAVLMAYLFKNGKMDQIRAHGTAKLSGFLSAMLGTHAAEALNKGKAGTAKVNTVFFNNIVPADRTVVQQALEAILAVENFDLADFGQNGQVGTGLKAFLQSRFAARIKGITYDDAATIAGTAVAGTAGTAGGAVADAVRHSLIGEGTTAMQKAIDWLKKIDFDTIYKSGELAKEVQVALDNMQAAKDRLSNVQKNFGVTVALLETRLDFSESYVNSLKIGAGKMTLADMNEEGANMMSLQSRQSMGFKALSIAGRQEEQIQRLVQ